jgi:hypothetical protein
MNAWEIWSYQPPGWPAAHPAVIVSHPARVPNKPDVTVVMGASQRATRPLEPHEVVWMQQTDSIGQRYASATSSMRSRSPRLRISEEWSVQNAKDKSLRQSTELMDGFEYTLQVVLNGAITKPTQSGTGDG